MSSEIRKPILLIPFGDVMQGGFAALRRDHEGNATRQTPAEAPIAHNGGATIAQWIHLTTQHPNRVQRFMAHPFSRATIADLLEVQNASRQLPFHLNGTRPVDEEINITGMALDDLRQIIVSSDTVDRAALVVRFEPGNGRYQVLLLPNPAEHPQSSDERIATAWKLSSLSAVPAAAALILKHSDRILQGARELIISGTAHIAQPQIVTLAKGMADNKTYTDYWVVPDEQTRPRGSSVALQVGDARERLSVRDLITALIRASTPARKDGKIPTIAVDIDGTIANARAYVWQIFLKWVETYQPRTDKAKALIARIQGELSERSTPISSWNTETLLKNHFGVTDPEILEDAHRHFSELFYNPRRSLEAPPIPGVVKLVTLLQNLGFKTIYPTLRSVADDELPDGQGSATIAALIQMGIWNEHSVLLRHQGDALDWRHGTTHEPTKASMVEPFVLNHPWIWITGVADNDPKHIHTYNGKFRGRISIHVEGDRPLGKEGWTIPDGTHSIRSYEAFEQGIDSWFEHSKPTLDTWFANKGCLLAKRLITAMERIEKNIWRMAGDLKSASVRATPPGTTDAHIDDALTILFEVTSYPKANRLRRSFIDELNVKLTEKKIPTENAGALMEIINLRNRHHGDPSMFTLVVEQGRIAGIRRLIGGSPLKHIDKPAPPVTHNYRSLPIEPESDLMRVAEVVSRMPTGPDLVMIDGVDRFATLTGENFDRMNALLGLTTGYLVSATGRAAHHIRATEYEPRISIAVLIALARLGINTGWHADNIRFRIHTQRQLDRLPQPLGQRISYRMQHEREAAQLPDAIGRTVARTTDGAVELGEPADLAIWNLPHPAVTVPHMGNDLVEGGLILVQSPSDYRALSAPGFACRAAVMVPAGEYVFPSAFLPNAALATPLHFQIWQRMIR